jgi:hypothetical protein
MRMRNCAHTYIEASLNIATKTENLIKKQGKKKHGRLLVSQVLAVVPNKEEEQGFRLFGTKIVSPQSHVKECKLLFWKPGGLRQSSRLLWSIHGGVVK